MGIEEGSSADWLPKDWKVEVKVRKTGKKDKCYIDPTNQHKFFSKLGVLRYLKNVGTSDSVHEETQTESNGCPSPTKFVDEDAVAEGLPAGWIKRTRDTLKGNKTRRDTYYIDPVSGHLFRSLKEISEYLETGKTSEQASKRKELGANSLESGQESSSLAEETEEEIIADDKEGEEITGNQILNTDACAMNNDNLPESNQLEQGNEKEMTPGGEDSPAGEVPLEIQQGDGSSDATKFRKRKRSRHVKGADMPRRTSKRLAGIEADPSSEPNLPTRARRAGGRQLTAVEVVSADDKPENLANVDETAKSLTGANQADLEPQKTDLLPPKYVIGPEENAKLGDTVCEEGDQLGMTDSRGDQKMEVPLGPDQLGVTDSKGDQKMEEPPLEQPVVQPGVTESQADQKIEIPFELGIPFEELWNDPCIEFAIKTLTGTDEAQSSTVNQAPSSNLAVDPCLDFPSPDFFADPCFQFAVKTLTGDLPIMDDPTVDVIFQQSLINSSETSAPPAASDSSQNMGHSNSHPSCSSSSLDIGQQGSQSQSQQQPPNVGHSGSTFPSGIRSGGLSQPKQ